MTNNPNEILELYKGVAVRHINRVVLKFGISAYKKLIDEVDNTGLSIQKILAYSGKPCDKCRDIKVVAYDKNENPIKIKRGILPIPETNGVNIIENNKRINNNAKSPRNCKKNK